MSSGFSSRTCLPALASSAAISRCVLGGVRTATAVMLRSSKDAAEAVRGGKREAARERLSAAPRSGSWHGRPRPGPPRSSRLLACGVTAMPRPMRAMRWRVMSRLMWSPPLFREHGQRHFGAPRLLWPLKTMLRVLLPKEKQIGPQTRGSGPSPGKTYQPPSDCRQCRSLV